jgi:hypothetical protein
LQRSNKRPIEEISNSNPPTSRWYFRGAKGATCSLRSFKRQIAFSVCRHILTPCPSPAQSALCAFGRSRLQHKKIFNLRFALGTHSTASVVMCVQAQPVGRGSATGEGCAPPCQSPSHFIAATDSPLRSKWEGLGVGGDRALEAKVLSVSPAPPVVLLHNKEKLKNPHECWIF